MSSDIRKYQILGTGLSLICKKLTSQIMHIHNQIMKWQEQGFSRIFEFYYPHVVDVQNMLDLMYTSDRRG